MTAFLTCLSCYSVYGGKERPCPNCGAGLVEIDENIAPIIVKLNEKGYETWACCAGHLYEPAGYIAFCEKYDLPDVYLAGFRLDEFDGNSCIRWSWRGDEADSFESLRKIHVAMAQLNEYVDKLPEV
jgi:hypothetical protein